MRLAKYLIFRTFYLWAVILLGLAAIAAFQTDLLGGVDVIDASDISPQQGQTTMSPDGVFTGSFTNNAPGLVEVRRIIILDKINRSMYCSTNKSLDVPSGGGFNVQITGCGERTSGEKFDINLRIDYLKNKSGSLGPATVTGTLGGTVD